jgi:hypothetical protein
MRSTQLSCLNLRATLQAYPAEPEDKKMILFKARLLKSSVSQYECNNMINMLDRLREEW